MNIKKSYASEISNVYSEGARANSNSKIEFKSRDVATKFLESFNNSYDDARHNGSIDKTKFASSYSNLSKIQENSNIKIGDSSTNAEILVLLRRNKLMEMNKKNSAYQMNNYNIAEVSNISSSANFMMTGHNFSSTYSANHTNSPKRLPDIAYKTHFGKFERNNSQERGSGKQKIENIINARENIKGGTNDFRPQSELCNRIDDESCGIKSRNQQHPASFHKLKTSSWLFLDKRKSKITYMKNKNMSK